VLVCRPGGDQMTSRPEHVQRRADPSGGSLVSVGASGGAADRVVLTRRSDGDSARRRADDLDAEAAYYRRRVIQEWQALAPVATSICSGPWLPTWPRWHSGYGPGRPRRDEHPTASAGRREHPPGHFPDCNPGVTRAT
jgi:hypothetical protein